MKRVLLDQGLPRSAAQLLRDNGWDAVHIGELGLQQAPDNEIAALAVTQDCAVVTLDRDFAQILALGRSRRPSVIHIRRQHLRAAPVLSLLEAIWREHESDIERGCMLTVTARRNRVRMLPLR